MNNLGLRPFIIRRAAVVMKRPSLLRLHNAIVLRCLIVERCGMQHCWLCTRVKELEFHRDTLSAKFAQFEKEAAAQCIKLEQRNQQVW